MVVASNRDGGKCIWVVWYCRLSTHLDNAWQFAQVWVQCRELGVIQMILSVEEVVVVLTHVGQGNVWLLRHIYGA
jgi:hypothetical protein